MQNLPSHVCTIEKRGSGSCLPPLPTRTNFGQRFCRNFKKYLLVSDRDPRIIEYFRTASGLMNEKRRQVESKDHYMIHPFSDFNYVHEAVMTLVFLICFSVYPFIFAFEWGTFLRANGMNILLTIVNLFCIVDILLRFFTGYVERKKKIAVLDQRQVIMHYVTGPYFVFDILSSLPTDLFGYIYPHSHTLYYMHFLRFLKVVRFKTFMNCFDRTAIFIRWNKTFLSVIRYFLIAALITHWMTCINYFIPETRTFFQGKAHEHSWNLNLVEIKTADKYVRCIFRTSGFMLGARSTQTERFRALADRAKGHLRQGIEFQIFDTPNEEMVMDVVTMLLGKIITSIFAVLTISRIYERYTLETKYQARMNQLNEFMKNKKLPLTMRDRLVQYYEHRYQKRYFKEEVITGILSESLKKEVNINVCRKLVYIVDIFAELPAHILSDVLGHLKAEVYLPNDIIIKSGTTGDCMYFLASGTVSVYTPSGREVCHLQDGAYFGEIALILKNTKRTTDIIAIEMCEVYRLDKKNFKACFKFDKFGVFEKMQQIAEERLQKTAQLEESYKLELFQKAYTEK